MPAATWRSNCQMAKPWATPTASVPRRNEVRPSSRAAGCTLDSNIRAGGAIFDGGSGDQCFGGAGLARYQRHLLDEQLQRKNPTRGWRESPLHGGGNGDLQQEHGRGENIFARLQSPQTLHAPRRTADSRKPIT